MCFFWASDPLLFPCFGGRVFGEPYRSEAEMHRKAKSRCEMSFEAAKTSFFKLVLAATFDIEDHLSTGQKTVSLSSPGHAVSLLRCVLFGLLIRCSLPVSEGAFLQC